MCRNGKYTEWGIKEHHGYARECYRIPVGFAVKVDAGLGDLGVLLEPAAVVAKALDHISRIGRRAAWRPATELAASSRGWSPTSAPPITTARSPPPASPPTW